MIGDIEKWIRQLFWSMADFIESERAIYGEKEQQKNEPESYLPIVDNVQ